MKGVQVPVVVLLGWMVVLFWTGVDKSDVLVLYVPAIVSYEVIGYLCYRLMREDA